MKSTKKFNKIFVFFVSLAADVKDSFRMSAKLKKFKKLFENPD